MEDIQLTSDTSSTVSTVYKDAGFSSTDADTIEALYQESNGTYSRLDVIKLLRYETNRSWFLKLEKLVHALYQSTISATGGMATFNWGSIIDDGLLMYKAWVSIEDWWHYLLVMDLKQKIQMSGGFKFYALKRKTVRGTTPIRRYKQIRRK